MADTIVAEQEQHVKKLKHDYEGWRELILTFNSILLWEKQWYPALIGGINTIIFLIFWLWDPSILTTISTLFLLATLIDCLVPKLVSTFYYSSTWSGAKEKKFEEICRAFTIRQFQIRQWVDSIKETKTSKPKLYYGGMILTLLLVSWIGNQINNLFLTYLMSSIILFVPGIAHHGYLNQYFSVVTTRLAEIFNNIKSKVDTNKEKTN